jgi:hypothetical protein
MLIVEDPTVTVKYWTAIKVLLLYFNLCLKGERNRLMIGVLQNLELIKKMKILQGLVLKHIYILLILNFPLNMEAAISHLSVT